MQKIKKRKEDNYKLNLVDYCKKIDKLIDEDPSDPEIFKNLQDLIFFWLLRARKMTKKNEAHDVATEMAGDLYMKIIDGFRVNYWLSYISNYYYDYTKSYRQNNHKQYFNFEGDPEVVYTMAELFSGSFGLCDFNQVSFSEVSNLDFIEYLPVAVKDTVKKESRYKNNSVLNLNLNLSLLISLIRADVSSFRFPPNDYNYIKLLKNRFKTLLITDLQDMAGSSSCYYNEKEFMDSIFKPEKVESEVSDFG